MNFNKSQTSAILHKDGPMLVLAGPGSGKTATLVERTKNLIMQHAINPANILVITFTKAAADQMKLRFEQEMRECQNKVTFGTFHAVFFKVLKMAYHLDGNNIVREDVKRQMIRELISRFDLVYRDENELISGLLSEISIIKNARIALEHFYSSQCGETVFRRIYKEYDHFLKKNRLLDFDDMLTMTYELFTERKDILQAWQRKYPYILVDEFQDINQIQYDILKLWAAPYNNLFMVGDDDQSIYRFRGAKPEIMLQVPKDYANLKQVVLDTNYRCPQSVVEASLQLIAHNTQRFSKKLLASKQDVSRIQYAAFETQKEEIAFVLQKIDAQLKKGYTLSDIAILFRTNTQPRYLVEQLMAYNIDFKIKDQIPNLYDHWIARDIRTYIEIARGSRKRKDFLMILNKPKRYIGRDSLCDSQVAFDEWEKLYDDKPWIAERIEKLHYDIKMLEKMSPYAAINYIRRGIGYDDYLNEYAKERSVNLDDLLEILEELQASAKGFHNYEAWELHMKECEEELKEKVARRNENSNAITISTLHSAKGLEFELVYILDVNEGIMPYKKALLDTDIEEERRLFYVGMTRTKSELTMCSVKQMYGKAMEPSRFIAEAMLS